VFLPISAIREVPMARWIDDLLKEWRACLTALPPPTTVETDDALPTRALDLLRVHVTRSGVEFKPGPPALAPDRPAVFLTAVKTPVPTEQAGASAQGLTRFGRRNNRASEDSLARRLARQNPDSLRTPADTRRAEQSFRAAAYIEVEALRADMDRLKATLSDIVVENRRLKHLIEAGTAPEPTPGKPSHLSAV
jgi:hypothetical protein